MSSLRSRNGAGTCAASDGCDDDDRARIGGAARRCGTGLAQLGVADTDGGCTGRGRSSVRSSCCCAVDFVPVARGWLRDEIDGWSDVVGALGGVWFAVETNDPDSDLGPVLARVDAPLLFSTIEKVGRRLGVKPPSQVRLTYLPCCGVVAWGRSRALLIGLPLFRVLTQGELRAIVGHELAHLARGDATAAARSARFVEALEQAIERNGSARPWSPGGVGSVLPA